MNKYISNNFEIILCTYNEARIIKSTITEILKNLPNIKILLVDDDSPDGTYRIVEKLKLSNIRLEKRRDRGLAKAFVRALELSNSKYIGWVDSNMPSIIKLYPNMINNLIDYDFVLLSRYVKYGGDNRSKIRSISSYIFNFLARLILGNEIRDYTSGLFVSKREVFENINMKNYNHGEFTIELLYKIKNKNIRILELPFIQPYEIETNSKSFPNIFKFLQLGVYYIKTIIRLRLLSFFNEKY